MIEDVESFCTELQLNIFPNREFTPNRQIHLPSAKASEEISRSGPEASWDAIGSRRRCKRLRIDRAPSRTPLPWAKIFQSLQNSSAISAVEIEWLVGNQICSRVRGFVRQRINEQISVERNRESCSLGEAIIKAPMMQQGIRKTILPDIRQVIRENT